MKYLILALLLPATATAAEFELTHSGRLADVQGGPVNGAHLLDVRLFDGEGPAATELWADAFSVSFTGGYFTVVLGSNPLKPLTTSALDAAEVWVEIELDNGGTPMNRTALTASPLSATTLGVRTGAVAGSSCDAAGELNYTSGSLLACDGSSWHAVGPIRITENGGVRTWTDGALARNCVDYLDSSDPNRWYIGATGDGVYRIDLDGGGAGLPQDVTCDMAGGGWIELAETFDTSSVVTSGSPTVNFYGSDRQLQVEQGACGAKASLQETLTGPFQISFRAKYGWGWAGITVDRLDSWGGDNTHDGCPVSGVGCWNVMNNTSNNLLYVNVTDAGTGSANLISHNGVSESTVIEIRRDASGVFTAWADGAIKHTYTQTYTGQVRIYGHTQCDNAYGSNTWVFVEDLRMQGD